MRTTSSISQALTAGPLEGGLHDLRRRAAQDNLVPRLAASDPSLWSDDPEVQSTISNRLGWIRIASMMMPRIGDIEGFARSARSDGLRDVVLMGMGGSSLCPTVLGKMFDRPAGAGRFIVLDSTDPDTILRIEQTVDMSKTLFLAASKSGRTVETLSHTEYFWSRLTATAGDEAGRHFAAVTDEGSHLQDLGTERGFRHVFINPSDIGGRYSALSYFGLVAGALAGVPLTDLLQSAMAIESSGLNLVEGNDALDLGLFLGAAAASGRDKLTFLASPRIAPLIPWIEQLIAESTGKSGIGIVPIEAEPLVALDRYGDDRAFVIMRFADELDFTNGLHDRLLAAHRPLVDITLNTPTDIGGEFLRWELATAIAGWSLGINPFDEPNVQESKDNTNRVLSGIDAEGRLALPKALVADGGITILRGPAELPADASLQDAVRLWGERAAASHYIAALAYVDESDGTEELLLRLRRFLLDRTGRATLRGYGPRYLHSIGQLYKGGPQTGAFLVISSESSGDAPIPNVNYSFQSLKLAQALGDSESLASRSRPVLHIHLADVLPDLQRFIELVERMR